MLYSKPTHKGPLLEGIVLGHMTARPGTEQGLKKRDPSGGIRELP